MKFTPIHRFRPQIQSIDSKSQPQFEEDVNEFGKQKYISLQKEDNSYLDGYQQIFPPPTPPPTPATTNENRIFIGDTALGSQYGVSYQDELPTSFLSPNEIDNSSTSFGSGVNNLITPFY